MRPFDNRSSKIPIIRLFSLRRSITSKNISRFASPRHPELTTVYRFDTSQVPLSQESIGMYSTVSGVELCILNGLKVNKKGKILDEEGDSIGEVVDIDLGSCVGKRCNGKGEVVARDGQVIGHVNIVPGKAAIRAMKEFEENHVQNSRPGRNAGN
jgi:hypothetical protein